MKYICQLALHSLTRDNDAHIGMNITLSSVSLHWAERLMNTQITDIPLLKSAICNILLIILRDLVELFTNAVIPVAISALAALETSNMGTMSVLSGSISGVLLTKSNGGIIGAYMSGVLTGFLMPYFHIICASKSFPTTATTIVSIGASSIFSGTFLSITLGFLRLILSVIFIRFSEYMLPIMEFVCSFIITNGNQSLVLGYNNFTILTSLLGIFLGYAVSWGSEQGYYHTIMLPIIAFEMQHGNFATTGVFDAIILCAPCAGICFTVWLLSRNNTKGEHGHGNRHSRLGWRGFISNFCFGDFVEACYPYTQPGSLYSSSLLLISVRISCSIAGILITHSWLSYIIISLINQFSKNNICKSYLFPSQPSIQSSAYLPLPLSIFLGSYNYNATNHLSSYQPYIVYASLITFFVPLVSALFLLPKYIHLVDTKVESLDSSNTKKLK